MNDYEKVFVSKDAIYIQIFEYENSESEKNLDSMSFLVNIIHKIFQHEVKTHFHKQYTQMTALQIRQTFNSNNYYPKESFIQYEQYRDNL